MVSVEQQQEVEMFVALDDVVVIDGMVMVNDHVVVVVVVELVFEVSLLPSHLVELEHPFSNNLLTMKIEKKINYLTFAASNSTPR